MCTLYFILFFFNVSWWVLMHYIARHIVFRREGRNIYRRHCSIKPEWESCPWCIVESVASIHHLHLPFFLQKQSALYAEMLNSKPVTHWGNSVTARIYLPIMRVCPHGSKRWETFPLTFWKLEQMCFVFHNESTHHLMPQDNDLPFW